MDMWMNAQDKDFFLNSLNTTDDYIEWGSGGSTLNVINKVSSIVSIEHDEKWYEIVSKEIPPGTNIDYRYVPSDKPRSFPHVKREEFETYITEVHRIGKTYDKVLIDGRARVWCAEEVREHLNPNAIVFIHDWTIRPFYHQVIEWYKVVGLRGSMCALKLK